MLRTFDLPVPRELYRAATLFVQLAKLPVETAFARGHDVVMVARSASRSELSRQRFEAIDGDALIEADVVRMLSGVDNVIQTLGVPLNTKLVAGPITQFS